MKPTRLARRLLLTSALCLSLTSAALAAAPVNDSQLAGVWQGGKTENDPYHGGYLNLTFRFVFSDGQYQETAYSGSTAVMEASGAYSLRPASNPRDPSFKNTIDFSPEKCSFSSDDAKRIVAPFPIPMDRAAQFYISLSPLAGGGQLTLQTTGAGPSDSWGLKRGR